MGVQVHFKGGNTIKTLLMGLRDRENIPQKSGVIYRYKCDQMDCDEEYIGVSERTCGERFKEHLRDSSPIYAQSSITCDHVSVDNFCIAGREVHNTTRTIKEDMYIRVNDPSINRNIGKLQLLLIWD